MNALRLIFFSGFSISFLGALPLGTLNMTALQIATYRGELEAVYFSIAVVLMELTVVLAMLFVANKIVWKDKWTYYLLPLILAFLLYLGASQFVDFMTQDGSLVKPTRNLPLQSSPFLLGLALGIINPLQFPFWMSWNKVLLEKKKLTYTANSISFYIVGIALGTMLALLLFILSGHYIKQHLTELKRYISLVLGLVYFSFAIYIIIKYYQKIKLYNNYV